MSKNKVKVVRHLVMDKYNVNQMVNGGEWSVIQTYSAQIADFHVYSRDCAKLSNALVVVELDSGEFEVVSDHSPRRDNRQTA